MTDQIPQILCHPGAGKSCGACCGMYNHVESSQSDIVARLRSRTLAYHRDARIEDEDSLRAFRSRWEDPPEVKLLRDLPSCPFLGLLDLEPENPAPENPAPENPGSEASETIAGAGRVGCLVHPLQNQGVDGRDCGVYDRFICEDYLCAAHDVLRKKEIRLVLDSVEDSYLYGLAITNPRFIRSLLDLVAHRTGADPTSSVLQRPEVVAAAASCFELMRQWPFRGDDGIFGQVRVAGPLETTRRRRPAESLGVESDPVDILLLCLGTECSDVDELLSARKSVEDRLQNLVRAIEEPG